MDLTGRSVGNYIVRGKLGSGGMGTVYLCEHPLLGRKSALKVLHAAAARDPGVVMRFFTEARATNSIGNEHIVDIVDFGTLEDDAGDRYYLLMEYLDGRCLADCVPGLAIAQAVQVARQCCDALGAAHAKGIVHRDLKPANIFLVPRTSDPFFVKIVDFGIAKLMSGQAMPTKAGMLLGTPRYMSPEQCGGTGNIDHRADIYALGVLVYEMVTKRVPFPGPALDDIFLGHRHVPPTPPVELNPAISVGLQSVVLHALEKDPDRRFQTMGEMERALADPEEHLLTCAFAQPTMRFSATAPAVAPAPARRRGRAALAVWVPILLVVIAVIVAALVTPPG